jgi:DNA invertase Pin-like site-specific DNA recombinase
MKVAIYCRVSTKDQDADKQESICREYCQAKGFEIYRVYKDVISGTTESRPEFNDMLRGMRSFEFNAIIVTKLDRMGRSLQHLLSILDELNNKKIEFIAVTQNIDTSTSTGKLQMQIMGAFAEFERNIISERTKEGLQNAKNVGKRGKDKKPRKRRAAHVRTIYKKKDITKTEFIRKLFKRTCKRCKERFETPHHTSKICPKCRGDIKSIN